MAKINIVEDEHAVLFTGYKKEELRRLGVDACNCAVLDSACSSKVCGDNWINNYINSSDKDDRQKVKQTRMIDKRCSRLRARECSEYSLPAVIAGKEVMLKTDVVESDIPLLLSRKAMKKAAIKMNLENDTVTIM